MTNNKAHTALRDLLGKLEPRHDIIRNALLGSGDGSTVATGTTNVDYVRLPGSDSKLVRALNLTGVHTYGLAVDVELVRHQIGTRGQPAQYNVLGPAKDLSNAGVPAPAQHTHTIISATHTDSTGGPSEGTFLYYDGAEWRPATFSIDEDGDMTVDEDLNIVVDYA